MKNPHYILQIFKLDKILSYKPDSAKESFLEIFRKILLNAFDIHPKLKEQQVSRVILSFFFSVRL